jgi:hypothetical protein
VIDSPTVVDAPLPGRRSAYPSDGAQMMAARPCPPAAEVLVILPECASKRPMGTVVRCRQPVRAGKGLRARGPK